MPAGLQNPRRVSSILTAPAVSGSLQFGYRLLIGMSLVRVQVRAVKSAYSSMVERLKHRVALFIQIFGRVVQREYAGFASQKREFDSPPVHFGGGAS